MWSPIFHFLFLNLNQFQKNVLFNILISQHHCCLSFTPQFIHDVLNDVGIEGLLTIIVETKVEKNTFDFLELENIFS